jgi:hypothetical protein
MQSEEKTRTKRGNAGMKYQKTKREQAQRARTLASLPFRDMKDMRLYNQFKPSRATVVMS